MHSFIKETFSLESVHREIPRNPDYPELPENTGEALAHPELPENSGEALARPELPENSGEALARPELPENSGEALAQSELPENSGEALARPELPENSGEALAQSERPEDPEKAQTDNQPETAATKIVCRNEKLEGQKHPETGVPFERKQVEVGDKQYEVVAPKFESVFDAQLPEDKYEASDHDQAKECNGQLKEKVAVDKELREKFDGEQLEQIENGDTPDGYTWHHDVEAGKMQLVETEVHQKTGHTGGRAVWGGGEQNR